VLGEGDLGFRVVVRYRLADGRRTDTLGELIESGPGVLAVRRDSGEIVRIPRSAVEAGKRVPPPPPKYSAIAALELVADRAWPAPVVEMLGQWRLRAADGWTARANSALPVGPSGIDLDDAIDACAQWYADRGQAPMITVPMPLRRDLWNALSARGWRPNPTVLVQTAPLSSIMATVRPAEGVALSAEPSPALLATIAETKSSVPAAGLRILNGPANVQFAEVRDPAGTTLAGARAVVVDDWMHLGLVGVVESARRRGLALAVTRALSEWGLAHGATRAVLQVEERNAPAIALYGRLGFATHHTYATFVAPASG
jgi:ribosomal protein S18 acetylase RimI-like enzyme